METIKECEKLLEHVKELERDVGLAPEVVREIELAVQKKIRSLGGTHIVCPKTLNEWQETT